MSIKSGQAVTVLFTTANATTSAATDATGTPAGTLYVNGTANGATVTVTNITTGLYKAALTLPSLSAGDIVSLRIAATVGGVAGEGIVWQETADTVRLSDVSPDVAGILADTAELQADWADGGRLDVILDARASQTAVDDIAFEIGNAGAGLTALATQASVNDLPTNAELSAAIAAGDDAVLAAIAALNNLSSAGAQAAAAAALAAYDAATGADVTAATAGLSTLTAAGVRAAVGLAAANLDTQLADIATTAELDAAETALLAAIDDISGGGSSAADIWAYGTRTLTTAAATAGAVVDGGDLTVYRGDTMNITLTGLGDIAARTALWFTVKAFVSDPDARALAQITEDDGLTVAFRDEAETPANGSLTVDDEDAGDVTVSLAAVETAQMPAGRALPYDVQMKTASGVTTLAVGNITFREDVTQAVS